MMREVEGQQQMQRHGWGGQWRLGRRRGGVGIEDREAGCAAGPGTDQVLFSPATPNSVQNLQAQAPRLAIQP